MEWLILGDRVEKIQEVLETSIPECKEVYIKQIHKYTEC